MEQIYVFSTSGYWVWITFAFSAFLVVASAMQLAKYGDVIAARTGLGGMFVGVLLLAGATSLPEVLTAINAIQIGDPNLAAGNFFGSNAFNMFILVILDILARDQRILRTNLFKHALSGSAAVFLALLVLTFISANPVLEKLNFKIGWVGIDSILIIVFYIFAIYMIEKGEKAEVSTTMSAEDLQDVPSLKMGVFGFVAATAVLILVAPFMVRSSEQIAHITGLGTSFIGSTLVAFVTSLPELVTTIAALKIGAADMAIGNLFGSNLFNMFGVAIADIFYTEGRFIAAIDNSFIIIGLVGTLLTAFGLIGNITRFKRLRFIELDSIIIGVLYLLGMYLLYIQGK